MSSHSVNSTSDGWITGIGRFTLWIVRSVGEFTLFCQSVVLSLLSGLPPRSVFVSCLYQIGVLSLPVVAITGTFIGMVLAIQSYDQFRQMHLENRLGAVINVALVKELGPVLAATMLAGRVGSAIAAELGTMKVTEQIDALKALGANPIRYLVVPRFLACVLMIPLLTALSDACGILGGWFFSHAVLGIHSFDYWLHSKRLITIYDLGSGLFKSLFFGGAIALVSCHRAFKCGAGAEGVGRAATESFVISFVFILAIDFLLGMILNPLYYILWPTPISLV